MSTRSPRRAIAAAVIAVATAVGSFIGLKGPEAPEPVARTYSPSSAYEIAATQDISYRVADRPAQDLSGAVAYIRTWMKRPAHRGEGYVIRAVPGMEWSITRPLNKTLARLSVRLARDGVGGYWSVMAVRDSFRMYVLKVDLNPAMVIDTQGTLAVDIIVGTVVTKFGNVPEWGIFVCKRISGSSSWSQHAYANAVDFGGDTDRLNKVAYYILDLYGRGYVPVSQILWRYHNLITGSSVSDHANHVHFSGPLMSGTPACA